MKKKKKKEKTQLQKIYGTMHELKQERRKSAEHCKN